MCVLPDADAAEGLVGTAKRPADEAVAQQNHEAIGQAIGDAQQRIDRAVRLGLYVDGSADGLALCCLAVTVGPLIFGLIAK